MKTTEPTRGQHLNGEGDPAAARHYNRHVREFIADRKVEDAARDAKAYVEQTPEDADRAERKAKRGPRGTFISLDELIAKGRTVLDRVKPLVSRIRARFEKARQ